MPLIKNKNAGGALTQDLRSSPDAESTKSNPKPPKTGLASKIRGMQDAHARMNADPRDTEALQIAANFGKKTAGKVVDKGIDTAAQALAAETAGISLLAAQAIKRHKRETLILILIFGFILLLPFFFLLYLLVGNDQQNQQAQQGAQQNPLVITKTGPNTANNGESLQYTITVQYPGTAQDAVITDPIPDGTSYVSSTPTGKLTPAQAGGTPATVTWDAKTLKLPLADPINIAITLTLKATKDNNEIGNVATVTLTGAQLAGAVGGNIPATNDNCHGVYSAYMASVQSVLSRLKIAGANYGDPACQLTEQDPNGNWIINKDKILAFLKATNGGNLPTQEAEAVFICILPNESSYNADAFNPNSTSAGSSGTPGAFGLFQMNAQGFANTNQPEDVGDVVWSLQITNAIAWKNKYNGGKWSNYWPQSYQGCLAHYGQ